MLNDDPPSLFTHLRLTEALLTPRDYVDTPAPLHHQPAVHAWILEMC